MVVIFIAVGVLVDIFSCYLFLRRNRRGYGSSGILIATPIVFYFFPIIILKETIITASIWLDCIYFACFHVIVVLIIPLIDKKLLQLRRYKLNKNAKDDKEDEKIKLYDANDKKEILQENKCLCKK
jgi:hypothetical protein